MVFSRIEEAKAKAAGISALANAELDGVGTVNSQQIFAIIEGMLSFEACLYHEFLPLTLEANCLKLGMVHPEDSAAREYVERILSYLNCTLEFQAITAADHQAMLSAYLKHKETSNLSQERSPTSTEIGLPELDIQPSSSTPIATLAALSPQCLLQELLGRVLATGIGRLYFERHYPQLGRILWSQNGVVQCVLEDIPASVFQEVIDELKQLLHVPVTPVQQPTQVEIERQYQKNRLLLRLTVTPAAFGEEATLQVLRGTALKFYQQQQLSHLSRDALSIAQQLQSKLTEMQKRAAPQLSRSELEALPALNELLERLNAQIEKLQ